ncbi:unnamed protein product [Orchesella dallaii]|uniref:Odorant receptor n=1 Tax=Orchesella dallaii TaxID=48710 RepID=A0ABP1RMC7_9HEXA
MLFSRLKKIATFRLYIMKFSGLRPFYWDYSRDGLVLSHPFIFTAWKSMIYASIFVVPVVLSMLKTHLDIVISNNEDDDNNKIISKSRLVLVFGTIEVLLTVFAIILATILIEDRMEIKNIIENCLTLNTRIYKLFGKNLEKREDVKKAILKFELVTLLVCFSTIMFVAVFPITFFHSADPFHRMLDDVFGIQVTLSTIPIILSLGYGREVFVVANTFAIFLLSFLLPKCFCMVWMSAIMPLEMTKERHIQTKYVGPVVSQRIIWIYRCYQLYWIHWNGIMAKFRLALHFAMMQILVVAASVLLIRYSSNLMRNGEFLFLLLILSGFILPLIMAKLECSMVGEVVEDSLKMKEKLLNLNGRKSFVYKVAKSFRPHRVSPTHPFFTLSNNTFLEFLDVAVGHVVNCLLI